MVLNIAAISDHKIYTVDITGAESTRRVVAANSMGSPFGTNFDWVGDKMLSFEGHGGGSLVLYSLDLELPIWTYNFDSSAYWALADNGARKRSIVKDHLIYARPLMSKARMVWQWAPVALPGPKATEAISKTHEPTIWESSLVPGSTSRSRLSTMPARFDRR